MPVLQNHRALRGHDLELQSQGLPCDAVYAGYRVDRHGKSFMIHDGVVWEVLDESGV
ncbi:MEKHLA domain-containing protein [Pseudomonas iridis]|nr:MEKHLA domain-containing protein [Pseudomonas iridis]